jgi:hypothetical protein
MKAGSSEPKIEPFVGSIAPQTPILKSLACFFGKILR